MSDNLISRQHVTYTIDKYISGFDAIDANFLDGLKTAKKLIKELPSAQPEIIRCKDCGRAEVYNGDTHWYLCNCWKCEVNAYDYCSRGKRRG